MQIIDLEYSNPYDGQPTSIALGNFDGVHIGHRDLIQKNVEDAKAKGLIPSVLLFRNHTADLVDRDVGKFLTSLEDKIEYLEELGIQQVFLTTFNRAFMSMSDEAFVNDLCVGKLKAKSIIVGDDYRFGFQAMGDVKLLKGLAEPLGVCVHVIQAVEYEGVRVSSTLIRKQIRLGNVEYASRLMGRPFRMRGVIRSGKQRGRDLGYPTANLGLSFPYVIPTDGVYLTKIDIEGSVHYALTDIGTNPTFMDEVQKKIETFILDFDCKIYGYDVKLSFLKFMRIDYKYDSIEPLIAQMQQDEINGRALIAQLESGGLQRDSIQI